MFQNGNLKDYPAISTSDNSLKPTSKFTGDCLKKTKITYTHEKVANIYIVYELGASSSSNSILR